MTGAEKRRCMWLLQRAKGGDEHAYDALTGAIARHFGYVIKDFVSADPVCDREDLRQEFRIGIWQAIDEVDHRGDPLFHLAVRGRWQVCSLLQVLKRRRYGSEALVRELGQQVSVGTIPDAWDPPDTDPESDPPYALEIKESQDEARGALVQITARADLRERDRDVVAWFLSDEAPHEKGANKRLAQQLGVSEQRASVLRQRTLERLADA